MKICLKCGVVISYQTKTVPTPCPVCLCEMVDVIKKEHLEQNSAVVYYYGVKK